MTANNKLHQSREFDPITKSKIGDSFFESLKEFASHEKNYSVLKIDKGGSVLKPQQYVGSIVAKNGYTLEILPKISVEDDDEKNGFPKSKQLLLKMLSALNKKPFTEYNNAAISIEKLPVMEIFISLFLHELAEIVNKGIIQNYSAVEGNFLFMKGKLHIAKHLQYNHAHRQRFYIQFDQRLNNVAENRLVKSCLVFLSQITNLFANKALIAKYLDVFADVDESHNIDKDFAACHFNRTNEYYGRVIEWCRVFLASHSFSVYSGKKIAYALLFDMNILFEAYLTRYCKKHFSAVTPQAQWQHLITQPKNEYVLKPDIVIGDKNNCIILDAKWKNYKDKIWHDDLYQLYAYGKKYQSSDVCLVYPKTKKFLPHKFHFENEKLKLHIICFDCQNDVLHHNDLLKNSCKNITW